MWAVTFEQLEAATTRLYEQHRYQEALDLIADEASRFDLLGHRCRLGYYRACLLARLGSPGAALDVLEAGVSDGLWWSAQMLADADLDDCRGDRLDRVTAHALPSAEPRMRTVHVEDSRGVVLALHGGGEIVDSPDNPWSSVVDAGWTVHRPVSGQRVGAGIATWNDLDLAVEECRDHLRSIGRIDMTVAFSLGCSLALRVATEVVKAPILMVAPSLRPAVVQAAAERASGLVIHVVTGDADPFFPRTDAAVPILRAAGDDVTVHVVDGLGHEVPSDIARYLSLIAPTG